MQEIRNSANKLVCRIDKQMKICEIVIKGCKTTIQFLNDGQVIVTNKTMY